MVERGCDRSPRDDQHAAGHPHRRRARATAAPALTAPETKRLAYSVLTDHKEKYWKFSTADLAERQFWDQYTKVYEEMLSATSTDYAPWFIVPADYKWAARTFVAEVVTSAISGLNLSSPEISAEQLKQILAAKKELETE